MATMHRWKYSALAAAVVTTFGLYAADASALALGPITVQSALGEPLRAEIDLPQITPAEADTLRASTAAPEVFRSQGMEYSTAVTQMQVQLQRRPDGRMVLRLSSDRPINDPFVDLVIDATWGTGRITRSYTMLFDPPALRRPPVAVTAPAQITAPQTTAAAATPTSAPPAPPAPPAAQPVATAPVNTAPASTARPEPKIYSTVPGRTQLASPRPAPKAEQSSQPDSVTVRPGDTAGRIAGSHRLSGVSLDQMLVALMRANPESFVQGNVNRLKAGTVLQLPDTAQAQATSVKEARQIIAAQSRDFNEFRRKLAGAAPVAQVAAADRSATGAVQTRIEDKRPVSTAPDKLTLSKGAMQGQKATEELLAQRKQTNEAAARVQELSKNIDDLNRLSAASAAQPGTSAPTPAPAASTASALPAVTAPSLVVPPAPPASAPAPEAAPAPAPSASEAATQAPAVPASAPASQASAPAEIKLQPPPAPAPAPIEEPSFMSALLDDPMVPLAGGGLLALLLGYGAYRAVQRKRNAQTVDSSFFESRLQPDSFFNASGGQRVDTASTDSTTGSSSMAYTPSQLDAGGDVDPVAEADVYLAYGRDLQAEEILKEAARHTPTRVSIHTKLGEIYAKRQDRKALEVVASEVHKLTNGEGPDWNRITELGRDIDPDNPLYQPGGQPTAALGSLGAVAAAGVAAGGFASTLAEAAATTDTTPSPLPDMDLNLDLDLDLMGDSSPDNTAAQPLDFAAAMAAEPALPEIPATPTFTEPASTATAPDQDLGLSWDMPDLPAATPPAPEPAPELPTLAELEAPATAEPPAIAPPPADPAMADLDFALDISAFTDTPAPAAPAAPAPEEPPTSAPDSGLMEFDLGSLTLDLDPPSAPAAPTGGPEEPPAAASLQIDEVPSGEAEDPLDTKLALALEFNAIGDSDGARTLIEEVIAESSGALKARAQSMLAELS